MLKSIRFFLCRKMISSSGYRVIKDRGKTQNVQFKNMARSVIVVGNGLGRALDNQFFMLSSGLSYVWNSGFSFERRHKDLMISTIDGVDAKQYPELEDQLDKLQVAIMASDFLRSFETEGVDWLNSTSREIPEVFKRFVHEVALYFHTSGLGLPDDFVDPLVDFIRKTSSHVAVLNYDNLLYDAFVSKRLLNGYHDTLFDGFHNTGFRRTNLDRFRPNKQAWYLHLHGSPLFVGNMKRTRDERHNLEPSQNSHIVLTNIEHKPIVIESSDILREYWTRLGRALSEADRAILVGYSGLDSHLNEIIASRFKEKQVIIVERKDEGPEDEQERFWKRQFPEADVSLIRRDNILDFHEWEDFI